MPQMAALPLSPASHLLLRSIVIYTFIREMDPVHLKNYIPWFNTLHYVFLQRKISKETLSISLHRLS
jgi:hypothetical protein